MEGVLIYIAKSAGILLLFYISYLLLLKNDTNFYIKRRYLLAGILTSAILPAIYFSRYVITNIPARTYTFTTSGIPTREIQEHHSVSLFTIITAIYFIGIIFMSLRLCLQLYSLFVIIVKGKVEKNGGVKFVRIEKEIAPFSFLNYVVFNPELHTAKELQYILKHEKVHTQQWHSTDVILSNLNLIFQWFNPIAWLYNKCLQENLEFIADAEAVASVPCRKEYQKALVQVSTQNFHPALTNNFYQSFVKKRIVMLNNNKNSRNTGWKVQPIIPVLIAFMLIFNVKTIAQINSTPTTYAQDSAKDKVQVTATITRTSTKNSLEKIEKIFEKRGIELNFEDLQYSSEGILTAITARFQNKKTGQSGIFTQNKTTGIPSFEVYVNEKNEMGFRTVKGVNSTPKTTVTITNNGKKTGKGDSSTVGKGENSKDSTTVFSGKKSHL